jgi:hypothetical protein
LSAFPDGGVFLLPDVAFGVPALQLKPLLYAVAVQFLVLSQPVRVSLVLLKVAFPLPHFSSFLAAFRASSI